jgi:putative protein kinase ArgK-like GTPase of G3E family
MQVILKDMSSKWQFVHCFRYAYYRSVMSNTTLTLGQGILNGKRDSLARAITLIESTRQDHKQQAGYLLDYLARTISALKNDGAWAPKKETEHNNQFLRSHTLRLGIAGPPGAGMRKFCNAYKRSYIYHKLSDLPLQVRAHSSKHWG